MRIILATVLLFSFSHAISQEIKENILENPVYIERTAYFKTQPLQQGQIVFLGNSLTQGGAWNTYFPNQDIANRGISGDNTEGMLFRLEEITAANPRKVFVMAGINDVSLNRTNKKIKNNIQQIINRIKKESPETKIYLQSVLPINNDIIKYSRLKNKEKQIEKLNKDLRRLGKKEHITFINIYPFLLIEKRKMNPHYTNDGLHLTKEGYNIWVEQIRNFIVNN